MIFRPELAKLVAQGKKTQTRRLVNGKPSHYEVGHDYAVCPGRGKHQICRVTILDRKQERLGELTYEDARAEGFRTRADFARYWIRLHDQRHDPAGLSADEVLERWQQLHGHRLVWVITFELKRVLPVVLASRPVYLSAARSTTSGTTTDPRRKWPGEPELMGTDPTTGSIARARLAAERQRQAQLQHAHGLAERARAALAAASAGGTDVAELERVVAELEAKLSAA